MKFVPLVVAAAFCLGLFRVVAGETIGSPLQSREFTDIDSGQVYIYSGTSAPFLQSGNVASWSFFDDRNSGKAVTPLLFQITSPASFTLAAIGTTRTSTGVGLQSFAFDAIAGSDAVSGGSYTFGFTNRTYAFQGSLVAGPSNTGVISFNRPSQSIPVDSWLVTAGATTPGDVNLQIGSVIGDGGITIYNSQDPGGLQRVYSAQMTVPEPAALGIVGTAFLTLALRRRNHKTRMAPCD